MKKRCWSRATSWLAFSLLIGSSGNILAETGLSAAQWLTGMTKAFRELNYEGQFIYQHSQGLNSIAITHSVTDGQERERLVFLDGPKREVVRDGNKVVCINADNEVIRFERGDSPLAFGRVLSENPGKLAEHYSLKVAGKGRVAGREAVVVLVQPKDEFRYGYEIWLDEASSLLLKLVLLNRKGEMLERLQFTSLEVGHEIPETKLVASLKGSVKSEKVIVSKAYNKANDKPGDNESWYVNWVPPGFELFRRNQQHSPVTKKAVESLMYTDGLAGFSVFVEAKPTNAVSVIKREGAITAFTKVLSFEQGEFLITVVGELPLAAAERIAMSVKLQKGSAVSISQ
ncbi:MucB/RseB C-terminal domain-containing protein [Spartinivicinus poritis]|uniref:MucB/RseB C-terminal domain-containing protein n=1 Tax=Spartinivicinus poritis TaxID=2994640 RepID=A0ABT5U250_9GAMM|nr:MucB/RseB C-terminal domain-containing protein [Spartinivicinus sp. A2-2]MDE1460443.1 MucB/RseB C-terminal domain-containing protein [Spartinivicinus sp. A2-2]